MSRLNEAKRNLARAVRAYRHAYSANLSSSEKTRLSAEVHRARKALDFHMVADLDMARVLVAH